MGATINIQDECGYTALHYACQKNYLDIAQLLVNNGASTNIRNMYRNTPLMLAALERHTLIIDYLTADPNLCSKMDYIEAMELLGTAYCNEKKSTYSLEKTYDCFLKAMKLRYENGISPIVKCVQPPPQTYDYHTECQTSEELQAICCNGPALHMETLLILERIYGMNSQTFITGLWNKGTYYNKTPTYNRCLSLWLRALDLSLINNQLERTNSNLRTFAYLFWNMFNDNFEINLNSLIQVFKIIVKQLIQNKISNDYEAFDKNLYTTLCLISVISKVKV
ncbi:unnamed protein product [Didymodactylos carnosus]|uniref:Protein fem-1 homolog B n=1 Tax=Didymodactylos carnosus TaxID=1234261 RepID=A0A816D6C2_9BILA|nr:unnamed protein product [Didymodactylos carnosus]CAF4529452.1 unnamed protein product [Didymodactylos carnosus]